MYYIDARAGHWWYSCASPRTSFEDNVLGVKGGHSKYGPDVVVNSWPGLVVSY